MQINLFRRVVIAKASVNCALVLVSRPETEWSTLGQDEVKVTLNGGPNTLTLKSYVMNWGEE